MCTLIRERQRTGREEAEMGAMWPHAQTAGSYPKLDEEGKSLWAGRVGGTALPPP